MNTSDLNSNRTEPLGIDFGRAAAYETALLLRFWDKALVPDEITAALGIQPHIAHPAGVSLSPWAPPPMTQRLPKISG